MNTKQQFTQALLHLDLSSNTHIKEIINELETVVEATCLSFIDIKGKEFKDLRTEEYLRLDILKKIRIIFESHIKYDECS